MARSRRLGAAVWTQRAIVDTAEIKAGFGLLDTAASLLDELDAESLPDVERFQTRVVRYWIETMRGQRPGAVDDLREAASFGKDSSDPQMRSIFEGYRALVDALAGEWASAFDYAANDRSVVGFVRMMTIAMALRDPVRIDQAVASAEEHGMPEGRLNRALRMVAAAAIAAINDDIPTASTGFVEALNLLERIVDPLTFVEFQTLFCMLVGADHPRARAAGQEALEWVRHHGAHHFEDLWAERFPLEVAASETA